MRRLMGNVSTVVISTVETLPRISDSDVYVMLALHRRFRQVIVANEHLDGADVVGEFLRE
jgi:hypothetical protein